MAHDPQNRPPLTSAPAWQQLKQHRQQLAALQMRKLFADDPERATRFSLTQSGLTLDYSKHLITDETLELLIRLGDQRGLHPAIAAMFRGERVNGSETRPALHVALRADQATADMTGQLDVQPMVRETLARMEQFTHKVRSGQWTGYTGKPISDVVNIGIGGSFQGPQLVTNALTAWRSDELQVHYLANVDGSVFSEVFRTLNPETTLVIIASKSFGTQETRANALSARRWFLDRGLGEKDLARHFVAISAATRRATEFGIAEDNIFPMWDWVGGRYSLWSAIGLPIALAVGMDQFRNLLRGASGMDQHFLTAPLHRNMPVIMGLLGVWYSNFWDAQCHAVLPYDHHLRNLPEHLQQLDMESSGKSVSRNGEPLDYHTGPVIWGGVGTNGQHSYHQLLHQGTHMIPVDFIMPLQSHNPVGEQHAMLFANCLSQSEALMRGRTHQEAVRQLLDSGRSEPDAHALAPHLVIPGNRPSSTIIFDRVEPHTLGALIALYEHKVYTQGCIWNINSFDQWGVELGKQLGDRLLEKIRNPDHELDADSSTLGLLQHFRQH